MSSQLRRNRSSIRFWVGASLTTTRTVVAETFTHRPNFAEEQTVFPAAADQCADSGSARRHMAKQKIRNAGHHFPTGQTRKPRHA